MPVTPNLKSLFLNLFWNSGTKNFYANLQPFGLDIGTNFVQVNMKFLGICVTLFLSVSRTYDVLNTPAKDGIFSGLTLLSFYCAINNRDFSNLLFILHAADQTIVTLSSIK